MFRVSMSARGWKGTTPMTCDFERYGDAVEFLLQRGYVRSGFERDTWDQRFCTAEIEEVA